MQANKKLKIFIIAGEVSGDVLGAKIIEQMKDIEFVGVGGENMISAGLKSIFPMSDLSVIGAVEVIANTKTLLRRIYETANAIIKTKPDLVLTIDSPEFVRVVIKRVRRLPAGKELIKKGLRFHHIVAPQVWAWRKGRAKKYAKVFDKLYSFFDFEVPYFTKYGLDTVAVGHPAAESLIGKYETNFENANDEKIITLVLGSRMPEVKKLMPIFQSVAERLAKSGGSRYKFVIPMVETTANYVRKKTAKWSVPVELIPPAQRYEIYSKTYIAIVASGTVSAELAMLHIPTIVIYKMNPITMWMARQVIYVKWVSLVNILLNRNVYPEFLGSDLTVENILNMVQKLGTPAAREKMIEELKGADALWSRPEGAASSLIVKSIRKAIQENKAATKS